MQLPPPAYEDVARAIHSENRSANISRETNDQRVEVHTATENAEANLPTVHFVSWACDMNHLNVYFIVWNFDTWPREVKFPFEAFLFKWGLELSRLCYFVALFRIMQRSFYTVNIVSWYKAIW